MRSHSSHNLPVQASSRGWLRFQVPRNGRYHGEMTAKELLLERAQDWTEAQAAAALRVVDAQADLTEHFDGETALTDKDLDEREDRWAEANTREAIREEPW